MVFMPKFNHLLTAGFVLAMAFTFSCNLGVGGGCQPSWLCPSGSEYKGGSCNAADYEPVNIGGQIWMAKNWGCYAPGSGCYEHKDANCEKYGRLYDWATAMDIDAKYNSEEWGGSNVKHRGICPPQWHIPSLEEWNALLAFARENPSHGLEYKRLISSDWKGASGTDDFGFSALPGGYARIDGERSWFLQIGSAGQVGSAGVWHVAGGEQSAEFTEVFYLFSYGSTIDFHGFKEYLFSIRCVKDE